MGSCTSKALPAKAPGSNLPERAESHVPVATHRPAEDQKGVEIDEEQRSDATTTEIHTGSETAEEQLSEVQKFGDQAATSNAQAMPIEAVGTYEQGSGRPFWACCCPCVTKWGEVKLDGHEFRRWDEVPVVIKTLEIDTVEHSLGYARTGDHMPEALHGIWWADQMWHSSIAQDPHFQAEMPFQEPPFYLPVLVGFGDWPTEWHAEELHVGPAGYGGLKGHWAFLGEDGATYDPVTFDFYFEDKNMDRIDLEYKACIPGIPGAAVSNWGLPRDLVSMYMEKRPWGWARTNCIGPDVWDRLPNELQEHLQKTWPARMVQMLRLGEKGAWQYPMLQIVDGDGRRTKYYDEYLNFMKQENNEGRKLFVTVFEQ